jgi:hypothetical protein
VYEYFLAKFGIWEEKIKAKYLYLAK